MVESNFSALYISHTRKENSASDLNHVVSTGSLMRLALPQLGIGRYAWYLTGRSNQISQGQLLLLNAACPTLTLPGGNHSLLEFVSEHYRALGPPALKQLWPDKGNLFSHRAESQALW